MTKILYYCDLHHGPTVIPKMPSDVLILGEFAVGLNTAILAYSARNQFGTVIHGGDEATFMLNPKEHFDRASTIAQQMTRVEGSLHRVIGNHDPTISLKGLGLNPKSYMANINDRNKLLVCQPQISKTGTKTIYEYDVNDILAIVGEADISNYNLIVSAHWAFDRVSRGYPQLYFPDKGYAYRDTSKLLIERLSDIADGNTKRVLSLHGHEHRFSLTASLGFQILVMPAITQADIDTPDKPCGLFAEITDDTPDGSLRINFRKITLNKEQPEISHIETVSRDYMQRYLRPVTVKSAPQ